MIARKEDVLRKLDAKERLSLQTKLRRTTRLEELAKREYSHERVDEFRTNALDAALPNQGAAHGRPKNSWVKRKEELQQKTGQRRKPAPGHRFDRNDPS
jgi:hypothetical protein